MGYFSSTWSVRQSESTRLVSGARRTGPTPLGASLRLISYEQWSKCAFQLTGERHSGDYTSFLCKIVIPKWLTSPLHTTLTRNWSHSAKCPSICHGLSQNLARKTERNLLGDCECNTLPQCLGLLVYWQPLGVLTATSLGAPCVSLV